MASLAIETHSLFREVQVAVFQVIESNVRIALVGVVFEFGMVGGERMKCVTMASLATSRRHVLQIMLGTLMFAVALTALGLFVLPVDWGTANQLSQKRLWIGSITIRDQFGQWRALQVMWRAMHRVGHRL